MKNLNDLEIPCVSQCDIGIEDLYSQRMSMIDCRSKEHQAYYYIKDFIERSNYTLGVGVVVYGYKFVSKGESYSCSVDSVVRECNKQCKILFDAGYCN